MYTQTKMNTLVCIFMLINMMTIVVCATKREAYQRVIQACMKEENVSETELKNFTETLAKSIAPKNNIKCYMRCVMQKQGYFKEGVFMVDAALKVFRTMPTLLDYPNLEKIVSDCKHDKDKNDCDTAFKITICLTEHNITI